MILKTFRYRENYEDLAQRKMFGIEKLDATMKELRGIHVLNLEKKVKQNMKKRVKRKKVSLKGYKKRRKNYFWNV